MIDLQARHSGVCSVARPHSDCLWQPSYRRRSFFSLPKNESLESVHRSWGRYVAVEFSMNVDESFILTFLIIGKNHNKCALTLPENIKIPAISLPHSRPSLNPNTAYFQNIIHSLITVFCWWQWQLFAAPIESFWIGRPSLAISISRRGLEIPQVWASPFPPACPGRAKWAQNRELSPSGNVFVEGVFLWEWLSTAPVPMRNDYDTCGSTQRMEIVTGLLCIESIVETMARFL